MNYAIVAENGVEVVNGWEKAKHDLVYIPGFRYPKKFSSREDATAFALNHLRSIAPDRRIPADLPCNLFIDVDTLDLMIKPFEVNEK